MSMHADLRFYAALRDFVASDRESGMVTRTFDVPGSVKDLIEACGVPHTEVDAIVVNGATVDFGYRVGDGDHIGVYPPFHQLEVGPARRVGPEPPAEIRFVIDGHLGKLARFLRLLGFDTVYERDAVDHDLVDISVRQNRILLTRDVGLLMHGALERGYFVRAIAPEAQLVEVVARFSLTESLDPFTRCMACNGMLTEVAKEEVADRLEPGTREGYDDFLSCTACGRVYWQGSHHGRLREIVRLAGGSSA